MIMSLELFVTALSFINLGLLGIIIGLLAEKEKKRLNNG